MEPMNNCNNMVISVHPIFAKKIIEGDKTVELRKRVPNIQPRTRLWIYATRPDAAVIGTVILKRIEEKTPEQAWAKYSADALIERVAFDAYFANAQKAYCLLLTNVQYARRPTNLEQLRRLWKGFHPPRTMSSITNKEAMRLGNLCAITVGTL